MIPVVQQSKLQQKRRSEALYFVCVLEVLYYTFKNLSKAHKKTIKAKDPFIVLWESLKFKYFFNILNLFRVCDVVGLFGVDNRERGVIVEEAFQYIDQR